MRGKEWKRPVPRQTTNSQDVNSQVNIPGSETAPEFVSSTYQSWLQL